MQQTLTEVIDVSLEEIIQRNFALTGGSVADQLAAYLTVVGQNYSPNRSLLLDSSLTGLAGNDTLTTVINLANDNYDIYDGIPENITAFSDGGADDDIITSTINLSYVWDYVTNKALGGSGNDTIRLTIQYTDYNNADGGNRVESFAEGGTGNDVIELKTLMGAAAWTPEPIKHVIVGGDGADTISSYIKATYNDGAIANVAIFGDKGADAITAFMQLDETSSRGVTEIHGGAGNDVIFSEVFNDLIPDEAYTITESLFGDGGKDRITSILHMDVLEDYVNPVFNITLTGGGGADTLISQGGDTRNHNTFDGGSGNDKMFGDGSVDEFLFIANIYQGSDQINNWDGSMDQLNISGLSNAQIDAISSIASVGADVVLSLDSGTVITFKGVGLVGVDSVSDLFWIGV